ncbi:putative LRR receptor-like serine/threonine-protein kinase MRH1 [Triticum urartu]|uniref:Putative LRR receptor-like serine/threonine-protein kinase MRH1 n=1 Tax=Triticum urartu TaxID=4572 RepID=M8A1U5_TRIUA|nr:putative LRR receptor-like serine/threonine-protein kinase MRH1 [Triticum urartu]
MPLPRDPLAAAAIPFLPTTCRADDGRPAALLAPPASRAAAAASASVDAGLRLLPARPRRRRRADSGRSWFLQRLEEDLVVLRNGARARTPLPLNSARDKHMLTEYPVLTSGGVAMSEIYLLRIYDDQAAFAVYCRAKKVGTVRPWVTGLSGQLQRAFVTGVPSLKRSELEAACEDFSNIIGSTANCMLYKGTLSSGVEIAVVSSLISSKNDWSKECESQYRKKISSLSKVGHKNFINLLGYCEEENPFTRAMVFEYAPNGTLFEHLHVREAENLDWMARLRISMGIAYCLEQMHKLNPPVVPRSFSSTTIHLTDDFAAKVSDLDFWNGTKGSDSVTDDCTMLDTESIVHQYGIILLEILTGRVPFPEQDLPLEQWASIYFEGKMPLAELMDSSLGSFPEETAHALCDVARSCIDPDPSKRPRMALVAAQMKEITAVGPEGATPKVSPLWWAELEIMSAEAT